MTVDLTAPAALAVLALACVLAVGELRRAAGPAASDPAPRRRAALIASAIVVAALMVFRVWALVPS